MIHRKEHEKGNERRRNEGRFGRKNYVKKGM